MVIICQFDIVVIDLRRLLRMLSEYDYISQSYFKS